MSYQGMMDGWYGDENECRGACGLCDDCDNHYYQRCDEEYEISIDEELFN